MKVAIICDWLIGGGGEKVVEELHKLYPNAPIYTSYCTNEWRQRLNNRVITGFLQHWPFPALRKFVPFLRGLWFSRLDLSSYDLVISASGAEAKFVKTRPPALHISYIHAPTHYYWDRYEEYLKEPGFGPFNWLARLGLRLLVGPMRRWDYRVAQRPDYLIANSNYTKAMIKRYYGRDAVVIHPPVSVERFQVASTKKQVTRSGFLVVGRQTPYKRIDLAVAACTKLNLPLTVIGNGPDHKKLVKLAGPLVKFVPRASDHEIANYLQSAEAFIFPGLDDFGIVAVEALAVGTPVIAYKAGGALDYVIEDKTGLFFDQPTVESLMTTLKNFDVTKFNAHEITDYAQKFSPENFRSTLRHSAFN